MNGIILYSKELKKDNIGETLFISNLQLHPGVYLLVGKNGRKQFYKKLIVL